MFPPKLRNTFCVCHVFGRQAFFVCRHMAETEFGSTFDMCRILI